MRKVGQKAIDAPGGKVERAVASQRRDAVRQVDEDKEDGGRHDRGDGTDEAFKGRLHEAPNAAFFSKSGYGRADYDGAEEKYGRQTAKESQSAMTAAKPATKDQRDSNRVSGLARKALLRVAEVDPGHPAPLR